MSIERLILRTLLVALHRFVLEALTQQRSQLGIAEFIDAGPVVDGLDDRRRLALEPVSDLLKRPALAINQRRVHELLGQRIDLLAVWVLRIDPVDLKAQRIPQAYSKRHSG